MTSLAPRQRYDIIFIEPKGETRLGCIDSFTDSDGITITKVFVKALEKRELFDARPVVRQFLLAFKPEKPENAKLVGFHQHLESASHKVAKIAFDNVQSKGYMYPVVDEKIHRLGYKKLFLVKVYEDNQHMPPSPTAVITKPVSNEPEFNPNYEEEIPPPPPAKTTEYFAQIDLSIYGIAPVNPSKSSTQQPPAYVASNIQATTAFPLNHHNKSSAPYSSTSQAGSSLQFGATSALNSMTGFNSSTLPAPTISKVPKQEAPKEPASFYQKLERNLDSRHETQILHLRNFNNFIKTELISHVSKLVQAKDGLKVLDLACGKGGDIAKWLKTTAGITYIIFLPCVMYLTNLFISFRIAKICWC